MSDSERPEDKPAEDQAAAEEQERPSRGKDKEERRKRSKSRERERKRSRSKSRDRKKRSRSQERRRRSRSRDRERRRRSRSRSRDRRRRSRSRERYRRRSRSPEYGYTGRRGRGPDPTLNFHDPFAALRSANQATDPAEIARQMQEQQLRARQLVLQQQAASAVLAASKTQREVYVGNLTAGLVTGDMLRQLFNSTMAAAFPDMAQPGYDPVVNVNVHTDGRYAFVELRTPDMASASLQLNGQVQLLGATLSIGRPSGYVDPGKAAAAATVAAEALARFQAETAQLRKQGTQAAEEPAKEETCYVRVSGMVTADVLENDQEYDDVLADIHEECNKYGTVLRVIVPRPPVPAQAAELIGTGSYGRAFVQFLDADGANKAREAIHGRMFAGSTVEAAFLQPQEFLDAIAPPEVPPQVPAAETPADVAPAAETPADVAPAAEAPADVAPAAEAPAPVPEAAEAAPVLAE